MLQIGANRRFWPWTAKARRRAAMAPSDAPPAPIARETEARDPAGTLLPRHRALHRARSAPVRLALRFAQLAALAGIAFFAAAGASGGSRLADPLPLELDRLIVSGGFGVHEVSLSGHRFTPDTDIYAALALDDAGSILRYDVTAARERIESLAWIDTASVVRVLPDKLAVRVTERQPAAVWQQNGRSALVDRSGRVLAYLAGSNLPPLPRVAGPGAPAAVGPLLAALEPHTALVARVAVAHRIGERRWTLELTNKLRIHLPADREGEALLRLMHAEAKDGLLDRPGRAIDLRRTGIITIASDTQSPAAARAHGLASAW